MLDCVYFSDADQPLQAIKDTASILFTSDRNLYNPYSKATCLILYLYSLDSFIHTQLNKACWNMDESKLARCGPFASALGYITSSAELNK